LQFVTSFGNGVFLQPLWNVLGDIRASMTKIASSPWLMRTSIVLDTLTALGIIFLGATLFVTLRKHGEKTALVALGFYIMEAALLAVSRMEAFSLREWF
jgi:small basic protein